MKEVKIVAYDRSRLTREPIIIKLFKDDSGCYHLCSPNGRVRSEKDVVKFINRRARFRTKHDKMIDAWFVYLEIMHNGQIRTVLGEGHSCPRHAVKNALENAFKLMEGVPTSLMLDAVYDNRDKIEAAISAAIKIANGFKENIQLWFNPYTGDITFTNSNGVPDKRGMFKAATIYCGDDEEFERKEGWDDVLYFAEEYDSRFSS